jgi:hypothetical protein
MNDLFKTYENSFLIDTSSLINISRNYAPYDNHENNYDKNTVKKALSSAIRDGLIYIHHEVKEEINKESNEAEKLLGFFTNIINIEESYSKNIQDTLKNIYSQPRYTHQAFKHFGYILDADPWLIAFAKYHGCTIVTDESDNKDWKIPWLCERNSISCTNTTQFISDLRNKYH